LIIMPPRVASTAGAPGLPARLDSPARLDCRRAFARLIRESFRAEPGFNFAKSTELRKLPDPIPVGAPDLPVGEPDGVPTVPAIASGTPVRSAIGWLQLRIVRLSSS